MHSGALVVSLQSRTPRLGQINTFYQKLHLMKKQSGVPKEEPKKEESRQDPKKVSAAKQSKDSKGAPDSKSDKKASKQQPQSKQDKKTGAPKVLDSKRSAKSEHKIPDPQDKKKADKKDSKHPKEQVKDPKDSKQTKQVKPLKALKSNQPLPKQPKKQDKQPKGKDQMAKRLGEKPEDKAEEKQVKERSNSTLDKRLNAKSKKQVTTQSQINADVHKQPKQPQNKAKINERGIQQEPEKASDVIQSSGLLKAYETFLKSLCKHGLPQGDVFEFAAQHMEKYQKRKIAKEFKEKAELEIRKKARAPRARHQEQQQTYQDDFKG